MLVAIRNAHTRQLFSGFNLRGEVQWASQDEAMAPCIFPSAEQGNETLAYVRKITPATVILVTVSIGG